MWIRIATLLCLSLTFGKGEVIYPKKHENQELATRIYCQVQEPQHFRYSSITELWGMMGGQIILDADITLRCVGDDQGGKFESEALKYRVQINNLQLTERKVSNKESMIRHRRGAGEFFSRSWDQIKQFFKRVFRIKGRERDTPRARPPVEPRDEPSGTPTKEDVPEDFVISDSMYSTPFQFVQFANGSIPEIRFTEHEIDSRVKNFKRHLVDAFSTKLNFNKKHDSIVEKSIMGEHTSTYNITVNSPAESLTLAGFGIPVKVSEPTVVVKKLVTEGDILQLAPSQALNQRENMNLKVEQMQIFQGGRMISSSGFSSLILLPGSEFERNRVKREEGEDEEDDITSHLQTHSTFDIQLQTRGKRSTERLESEETGAYVSASRIAEQEDDSQRRKFGILPEPTVDAAAIFEYLLSGNSIDYDGKMQTLFEMVEREVSTKKDKENGSVSSTVRKIFSKEVMQEFCAKNFSQCKDFLQLLALTGGTEAENVLLSFLTQNNGLSAPLYQTVADIISEIAEPSSNLLHSLGELVEKNSKSTEGLGALCLSLGYLASKSSAFEDKNLVSKIFRDVLKTKRHLCRSDVFVIDLLEAIGNLGSEDTVEEVLEVSALCKENTAVQIACAHALRHSVHLHRVQKWIENATAEENCDLIREIVGSLTDKIRDQEMKPGSTAWPRYNFNSIDQFLKYNLINENSPCPNLASDILLYFSRKKNPEANEVSRNHFGPDSGSADEQVYTVKKTCRFITEETC